MPRRDLTSAKKISFLDKMKKEPSSTSQRRLVDITGLSNSTMVRPLQPEKELRKEWEQNGSRTSQKRKREGEYPL